MASRDNHGEFESQKSCGPGAFGVGDGWIYDGLFFGKTGPGGGDPFHHYY